MNCWTMEPRLPLPQLPQPPQPPVQEPKVDSLRWNAGYRAASGSTGKKAAAYINYRCSCGAELKVSNYCSCTTCKQTLSVDLYVQPSTTTVGGYVHQYVAVPAVGVHANEMTLVSDPAMQQTGSW